MCRKKIEKDGKTTTAIVPAVSNLCFVHTCKSVLDDIFMSMADRRYAGFFWDKASNKPVVVPDKAMADFMQISRVMSDDVMYLKDVTSKLQAGQKVRVLEGPFKGVEGVVLRIKRSRRVVVDFPGLLAVATTFVDPRDLELI